MPISEKAKSRPRLTGERERRSIFYSGRVTTQSQSPGATGTKRTKQKKRTSKKRTLGLKSKLIISVSGLRGVVGESLTAEVAARYARAFALGLPPGPILITRDSRPSGPMLAEAICDLLCRMGRTVLDGGIAATPTTGVLIREHGCAGGFQISASHNPPEYNGMKLLSGEGRVISASMGEAVLERYRQLETEAATDTETDAKDDEVVPGEVTVLPETTARHLQLVLATVDVEQIRQRGFKVVLDANRGAGGLLGRQLLEALHCDVTVLGEEPTGEFIHPAEPLAENLAGVLDQVTRVGADVGFCQDPDADRLAIIDEMGRYVGEEYTFVLNLDHVLRQTKGPVATNCSSSRMSEDLAKRYDTPLFRSPVGEANVVELMIEKQAVFGGEGNGGPIDPRVGYIRDSFVGMALLLDAMASREMKVSQLADELPRYVIRKTKLALAPEKLPAALNAVEQYFANHASLVPQQTDRMDGLRLAWPDAWLLIRGSNTEPIVRVVAESQTAAESESLCEEVAKALADKN